MDGAIPAFPEFFRQFYVFSEPVVASKYWPVHSLLMAPGCLAGLPALGPVVFSGIDRRARVWAWPRVTTKRWTLFAWLLVVDMPGRLEFRASYFSQATTTLLFLGRARFLSIDGRPRHGERTSCLRCVSRAQRRRPPADGPRARRPNRPGRSASDSAPASWRRCSLGSIVVVTCLSIIPIWSQQTLGRLDTTPYAEYARQFFPFDKPGFSIRWPCNLVEPLPADMVEHGKALGAYFETQRRSASRQSQWPVYPRCEAPFGGWRLILLPLAAWASGPPNPPRRCEWPLRAPPCCLSRTCHSPTPRLGPCTTWKPFPSCACLQVWAECGSSQWGTRWGYGSALWTGSCVVACWRWPCADVWTRTCTAHVGRHTWRLLGRPSGSIAEPAIVFVGLSPRLEPGVWSRPSSRVHSGADRVWVVRSLGRHNTVLRAVATD